MSKDNGELIIKKSINLCCQPIFSYISSLVIARNASSSQSLSQINLLEVRSSAIKLLQRTNLGGYLPHCLFVVVVVVVLLPTINFLCLFHSYRRNYRATWPLNETEAVAGNYYPVNSRIFMRV